MIRPLTRKLISGLFLPVFYLGLPACALLQSNSKVELTQNADVKVGSAEAVEKKSGDVLELSESPILISALGKVPILVVPVQSTSTLKVELPEDIRANGSAKESKSLNDLVRQFVQAQVLVSQRQPARAIQILDELQRAHPQLVYLNFLKSSCLISLGKQAAALAVLEEALLAYPDDVQGKKLYEALQRENKSSPSNAEPHGATKP